MPNQIYVAPETMGDDYQEIKTCPYDPSHRVHAKRFLRHIMKCQKNYPNARMQKCPFNATHIIPDEMYTAHLENCPDKAWLECQMQAPSNPVITGDVSIPVTDNSHFTMSDGEDWDKPANSFPVQRKPRSEIVSGFRPEDAPENFKRQMLNSIKPGITTQRRPTNKPRSAMRGRGINRIVQPVTNNIKISYGRGEPFHNQSSNLLISKTVQKLEDFKFDDAEEEKEEDAAEDPWKLKKKLEKKLRELKQLENLKDEGKFLDADQRTKLATKTEVLNQLKAVNLRCLK